ncbi:energy-coupling factor transporter ATPase [Brevibacillus sp. FSL K6-0770]|uniref:ABC transporter ATP-binding protein n=1 Tax=Brevibacillus sp. FSL K6-0770 TaxID=2954673 RepID=UPI0030FCE12E
MDNGVLDVRNVCFGYDAAEQPVLTNVTFRVQTGELLLIMGASGAGKSTLALTLNGLIPHAVQGSYEGDVRIAGRSTSEATVGELAMHVGMVFQDPEAQLVAFTVEDEVAFGLENLCLDREEMERRITQSLAEVGLSDQRKKAVEHLSGGQKQRLAIASVLAMQPQVIVLDEPTALLDPAGRAEVFAVIERLKQGGRQALVLVEHHLDECIGLADRVLVLGKTGEVSAEGEARRVFSESYERLCEEGVFLPETVRLSKELGLSPVALCADEVAEQIGKRLGNGFAFGSLIQEKSWSEGARPAACAEQTADAGRSASPEDEAGVPLLAIREGMLSLAASGVLQKSVGALTISSGELLAIAGANGAGKTTLALHLMGLLPAHKGALFLSGKDMTGLSMAELVRNIGFVFQNPEHQFVAETAERELVVGMPERDEEQARVQAQSLLQRFGLASAAGRSPYQLSQGEKRRLSVATMLTEERKVLILDEPTFGQDQKNAREIMQMLQSLQREGVAIVLITHALWLLAEYADRVAVLAKGKLVFHGTADRLFSQPELLKQASLRLPPAAEMAQKLSVYDPSLAGIATYENVRAGCLRLLGERTGVEA